MSNHDGDVSETPPSGESAPASRPSADQPELEKLPLAESPKPEKRRREYKLATLIVAVIALVISCGTFYFLAVHTIPLQDKQRRQIEQLEASTPAGAITSPSDKKVLKKSDPNPRVMGTAQRVPDAGNLWIVLHLYIDLTKRNGDRYFLTPVVPKGDSTTDAIHWVTNDFVTVGSGHDTEDKTYRLTLYYCGSHDSQNMNKVVLDLSARRQGLDSLGSSCKQLDGQYITRLAH